MRVRSLLAFFCFGFLAAGQTPRPGLSAELPVYAHDYHSIGFSPLAEITPKNVAGLRQICSYPLPEKTTFEGTNTSGARSILYIALRQKSGDRFLVAYTWHCALHASTVAESLESCGFDICSQIVWVTF